MKNAYAIRLAKPADGPDISALLKRSYKSSFEKNYSKVLLRQILPLVTSANPGLLSSKRYFVGETGKGELIGCGGWSFLNPETYQAEPSLIHLRHFATDQTHSGLGIGRDILHACLKAAKEEHAEHAECFSSLNAVGFYEKCGFKKLRHIDVHITDIITFPTMLMGRKLT